MTISERYIRGDSVIDIAKDEETHILVILERLRTAGTITTAGPTVTERLDQDIHAFLDSYFRDEVKISGFSQLYSVDDNRRRLTPAYIYRILNELNVERRRKNNKLPRLKRSIVEAAIEEYQTGRTFEDVLSDDYFKLTKGDLLNELQSRKMYRGTEVQVDAT